MVVAWGLAASMAQAQDAGPSLSRVRERLLATPPTVGNEAERLPILQALDVHLEKPNSERADDVVEHYRLMVDRALDEVEHEPVEEGVRVWKLYSSSVIVKTPETVFGFDLDEGPYAGVGEPERVKPNGPLRMHFTEEQRRWIARLVDVSFHSHGHHDHIDYALTGAMVAAGTPVIVPGDIRRMWARAPFADDLIAVDGGRTATLGIGGLTVEVFSSQQWMAPDHSVSTPCNAYLVTTGNGVTVLAKGDINDGDDMALWLTDLKERGVEIDLYVGHLFFWWGGDALPRVIRMFDPFIVPGHEYEFVHRKPDEAGSGTGSYGSLSRRVAAQVSRQKGVVLSWGEGFSYVPAQHREGGEALVWIEIDPRPREIEVRAGDAFDVDLNATSERVTIRRWYLSFSKTEALRNLPGFDERDWGGILHDPDRDGKFSVSTEGWPVERHVLGCTVDDWPEGETRTSGTIEVTVLGGDG